MTLFRLIFKIFIFGAFAYILTCTLIYFSQDKLIFPGAWMDLQRDVSMLGLEEIELEIEDGTILSGVRVASKSEDTPLLLYFSGNANNVKDFAMRVALELENEVLAFNYRGYGDSKGMPSEQDIFSDALKIYDKYANDRDVIAIGRSLGSGVATYLGAKRELRGVILITPFDSITSIAKKRYPYLPISLLLKHRFESTDYIKDNNSKIAIIELQDDLVVSNYHTKKLIEAIEKPIYYKKLEGSSHGELLSHPKFFDTLNRSISYINKTSN